LPEKQHDAFFIKYSLEKARDAIKETQFTLDNGFLNMAESRLYYAMFYAVMALGYSEDFVTSKHAQLLGWFNKEFIHKRGIFKSELFKLYQNAYENRRKSDYEISYKPVKEKIEDNLKRAVAFIDEIESYIKSQKEF